MTGNDAGASRNAVESPILNSPLREPVRYWHFGGATPEIRDGRRPSGYSGIARTDRGGSDAQAVQEHILLPTVNDIRQRVSEWRADGYRGVTPTTRELLDYWHSADRRPLFFCQREAVETIVWLIESSAADRQGIVVPLDAPNPDDAGTLPLLRYCVKMATGSGKTTVMSMLAAWQILNKAVNRTDSRFSENILIVAPKSDCPRAS